MTYTEFSELMGALAVWRKPDPYVSLAKKMNEFLSSTLKIFADINNVTQSSKKKRRRSTTTSTTTTTTGGSAAAVTGAEEGVQ